MTKKKTLNTGWEDFLKRLETKDILAGILLIGGLVLISKGINHIVSGFMIMVTTYYFRKRIE